MDLSLSVSSLPGIGSAIAKKLEKLGIQTIFDLLYHLPFRYEDRGIISPIGGCQPGETVTLRVTIESIKNEFTHSRKFIQTAVVSDSSGSIFVTWFNQTYLTKTLKTGLNAFLYGKIETYNHRLTLISPDYEIIHPDTPQIHTNRLVPIYPETSGVSSKMLRSKIFPLLAALDAPDYLPRSYGLMDWRLALRQAHFPDKLDSVSPAVNRLSFDELLFFNLTSKIRKQTWQKTKLTHSFFIDQEQVSRFISQLPYTLTSSQNSAIKEILSDLSRSQPMNRLLEGDVGSGKTVVAAVAAYISTLNGFQTLILAPTQILAQQHFQTLTSLFKPFGIEIGLVTANSKLKIKNLSAGRQDLKFKIVVGTHAVLSKNINFTNVGLVVIDEQHRFGVLQRGLAASKGTSPHILTMTATPIPRTIALTIFGDLDLSILSQPPSGRLPVKTWVVPEPKRESAYNWIRNEITTHHTQAFIVCPFINESETLQSVKAASTEFNKLKSIFPQFSLGLLHGRLKISEKNQVLSDFRSGKHHLLVTTPVVEVGIDVPNASIMLIEGAERFGLAQLHQLRGRVGRGSAQSYCLLFSNQPSLRLKSMETHQSGIELAEIDIKLRGPGDIYGTSQHGVPQFKIAGLENVELIEKASLAGQEIFPRLKDYPLLRSLIKQDKIQLIQPN